MLTKTLRIKAIVTEEDFTAMAAGIDTGISVEGYMSENVVTALAQTAIEKMTRMIIQNGLSKNACGSGRSSDRIGYSFGHNEVYG